MALVPRERATAIETASVPAISFVALITVLGMGETTVALQVRKIKESSTHNQQRYYKYFKNISGLGLL